jgi:hypothetical protein
MINDFLTKLNEKDIEDILSILSIKPDELGILLKEELQNRKKRAITFGDLSKMFQSMEEDSTNKPKEKVILSISKTILNPNTKLLQIENFESYDKKTQDSYLKSLIISQKSNDNKKGSNNISTKWIQPRDTICKSLRVGPGRLHKIALNVFKNGFDKTRVHGNVGKIPHNKLTSEEQKEIRDFVLSLEFEWWPEELKGKEYCKVLSVESSITDVYNKFVEYKCTKDEINVDDVICKNTFVIWFDITCPDVLVKSNKVDVCNFCLKYKSLIRSEKTQTLLDKYKKDLTDHIKESQFRRITYKNDINTSSLLNEDKILVISFDFKQSIAVPTLQHQANLLYFKRKFNVNCFNLVNETKGEHNIFCYGETSGDKTADEF